MLPLLLFAAALVHAEYQPIFNGEDLKGWEQYGPARTFSAEAGELRTSGRGNAPNWIHSSAEYENLRLRFEYKLAQWCEASVILRAPRTGRPETAGITLVLAHDFHNETSTYITGALMGAVPPKQTFPASWGQWHKVEIELRGQQFLARIDGTVVQDIDLSRVPELRNRLRKGRIGFPDMGYAYALRGIEVEDLGSPTGFTELLQGGSLNGWSMRGDSGNWELRGDVIEGSNGHGILYAPAPFTDFELTAVVRTHSRVNSGIFLRGQPDGANRGFEVQIYSPVDAVYPTGSIYGRKRSNIQADLEERWFLLMVRVKGARCEVWVDGIAAAEYDPLPEELRGAGRIGLQIHLENAWVEFRDLRVRPL